MMKEYDPFGMPAGFYFGNVNSDLEFSTSFLVKDGVNFRADGTYFVIPLTIPGDKPIQKSANSYLDIS